MQALRFGLLLWDIVSNETMVFQAATIQYNTKNKFLHMDTCWYLHWEWSWQYVMPQKSTLMGQSQYMQIYLKKGMVPSQ